MQNATKKVLRLVNINIMLMTLSIVFFYISLQTMGNAQGKDAIEIINSNAFIGVDLIAISSKVFCILILFKLKLSFKSEIHQKDVVILAVMSVSQLLTQNYLGALILFYSVYLSHGVLQNTWKSIRDKRSMRSVIPVIVVLILDVLVLFIQLRIQNIVSK